MCSNEHGRIGMFLSLDLQEIKNLKGFEALQKLPTKTFSKVCKNLIIWNKIFDPNFHSFKEC